MRHIQVDTQKVFKRIGKVGMCVIQLMLLLYNTANKRWWKISQKQLQFSLLRSSLAEFSSIFGKNRSFNFTKKWSFNKTCRAKISDGDFLRIWMPWRYTSCNRPCHLRSKVWPQMLKKCLKIWCDVPFKNISKLAGVLKGAKELGVSKIPL